MFNVDINTFELHRKVDDRFVFGRFYIPQKDRLAKIEALQNFQKLDAIEIVEGTKMLSEKMSVS
ncbi:MAG: hypothetical protein OXE55_01745 [Flavobacteriaceae bacterium]|nr:hypothetical protein [Flavobacteriaceae bacterium]MCY4254091.1 hypothetical protein [Flavobacteriaceae bacterium]